MTYVKQLNNTCKVCGRIFGGQKTNTCKECLAKGVKWCKSCDSVKELAEFYYLAGNGTWDARCRECGRKQSKEYRRKERSTEEGRERCNERMRNYYENHKHTPEYKAYSRYHNYTRRQGVIGRYTSEEWIACLEANDYSCAYCGATHNLTADHIVAISKGGFGYIFNITVACKSCNSSKQASDVVEWYSKQPFYDEVKLRNIHKRYRVLQQQLLAETRGGDLND